MFVYGRLVGAQIRGQMQYRVSFLLQLVGSFSLVFSELLAVLILFRTFGEMAGWDVGEVALLYSLVAIGFGISELVSEGFDDVSVLIRLGDFDRVLTRPVPPFLQVMSSRFALRRIGRIAHGVVALGIAQWWLRLPWSGVDILIFVAAIAATAIVFFSVVLIGAAICFWTTERTEVQNVFTYGGTELVSYPMHIYNRWLRSAFLWLVPLGLTTYYPVLRILDKGDPLGLPNWLSYVGPLVAPLFFGVALLIWRTGMNHYQSTGS